MIERVSDAIRYDSFLVRHLAGELDRELAGQTVSGVQFDSAEQRLVIDAGDSRLIWQLHPTTGDVTRTAALYPLPDSAILPRRARVQAVRPLEDERVLRFELAGDRKENATFAIVVELLTNQWNAIALDHDGRVLRVLRPREGGRTFRRGQHYAPPPRPEARPEEFRSPLNESLSPERFAQMLEEAPLPALIETAAGWQPYPHHLWLEGALRFDSLLAAYAARGGDAAGDAVIRELERRLKAAGKKIERLRSEHERASAAERATRERADLLLAYASTVTRGAARVTLPGFTGAMVEMELDPTLSAVDNAQVLYAEARKHGRAIKRIPALLRAAEHDRERVAALLARAQRGELSDADAKAIAERPIARPQQAHIERLPYRKYRTSSGLEVRVGRNARSNDELTLRHSSPRDIWLHARQAGGAHVVLRWDEQERQPPRRDILEAATLAAVHSAARTAGIVPVDYTRRKYVRKPRRSPPGTVVIERAKTVFVEPDPVLEEKLRA